MSKTTIASDDFSTEDKRTLQGMGFFVRVVAGPNKGKFSIASDIVTDRTKALIMEHAEVTTEDEIRANGLCLIQLRNSLLDGHELSDQGGRAFQKIVKSKVQTNPNSRTGVQGQLVDTDYFLIERSPVEVAGLGSQTVYAISNVEELTSDLLVVAAGDVLVKGQRSMLKQAEAIIHRHPDQAAIAFACVIEQAQRNLANAQLQVHAALTAKYGADTPELAAALDDVRGQLSEAETRIAIVATKEFKDGAGARPAVAEQLALV